MQRLVERFIDFTHWSTSRKIVLLGCLSAPTTFLAAILNHFIVSTAGDLAVNLSMMTPYLVVWVVAQIAVTALAFAVWRAGMEGRWTAYLYATLQVPFIILIVYLYGTMSTPFVAIIPTIVILWILYFDESIAWYGFLLMLASLVAVHLLESSGQLPYAPMLHNRSIDAQQSTAWFVAGFLATLVLFSFSFSICLLILSARRLQEERLRQARNMLQRNNQLIRRYVPAQLAEQIFSGSYVETAKPERRKLTIFFSEIEGFTDTSEELGAGELAELLDEYLSEMMIIADLFGATVNQLVGDGIMMFFGAPQTSNDRDHALRAVYMSLEMQKRMKHLEQAWLQRGLNRPFRIRIGVNTGYASVGDFGSDGRKLYSAVGLQTNLAARIQAHCEPGRVLISHPAWALVHQEIPCVPRGEIQVKGVHYPVRIYEVTSGA